MSDDLIKKMLGDMMQNAGQGEPLPCSFGRSPFADLTMKAESGDVNAQNELGRLFRAERLYKYAFHWFLRAAKQGDVASQKAVGEMFLLCRKKTDGQGLAVSQNDELLHWAKQIQAGDKTAFHQFLKVAEQEKVDLEEEFDNRLGHVRKEWGIKELEDLLGLTGRDDSCCSYDPYYSPRYNPDAFDFEMSSPSRQKYLEDLKRKIKEDIPGIILATKEITYSWEYSGKCQVLMLVNKNIYKIPPYSQNAGEYFKRFYNEIRQENADRRDYICLIYREKHGRLRTLSECGRYEDYFVVEIPGAFHCTDVSFENKTIKQIVEHFKKRYMK